MCRFPARQFAGDEYEQGKVTPGERGAFHLSPQAGELLTQQGVFQCQLCSAADEILDCTYSQGISTVVGACPLTQALLDPAAE